MIHPALILSMMGSSNNATTQPQDSVDVEKAVANMEKAVATAAVVSMDQEVHPQQGEQQQDDNVHDEQETSRKMKPSHWIWILFQFGYSIYMIFNGLYFECDGIATLRTWSVMWGITTLFANVVIPLCHHRKARGANNYNNHHHQHHGGGSHLLLCFIML